MIRRAAETILGGFAGERLARVLVAAWTLLAWGLRLYGLDLQPLRGDEVFGAVVAMDPTAPAARDALAVDPLAPYYRLLQGWIALTGPAF